MPKTISFHCGSAFSRGHNIRDERYTDKQKHIDKTLSDKNEIICDYPVREKYNEIFGQAVEEYNAHQSRADRKIDDYYLKIKSDKRKNPVYEVIVQIGDKDDTGNLAEKEKAVLRVYAQEWEKRNPNLKLTGAYIHADEPNGTVHAHIDFIPVSKSSRGMKLQNSFAKALEQQGHKGIKATQTAQMSWQQSERECIEQICSKYQVQAKANQNKAPRPHLSVAEYQNAKESMIESLESEMNVLRATETAHIDELSNKAEILQGQVNDLTERHRELTASELKTLDVTPKRLGGGFKGLTPEQAQQLLNTSINLKKENKSLKQENSTLTEERNRALERAAKAEEQNRARISMQQIKEQQRKSEREQKERERAEQFQRLQQSHNDLIERYNLAKNYLSDEDKDDLEFDFQFSKGGISIRFEDNSEADEFEEGLKECDYQYEKYNYDDGMIEFLVPARYSQELNRVAEDIKTPDFTQGYSRGLSR